MPANKVLQRSQIGREDPEDQGTAVPAVTSLLAIGFMPVREGGANVAFAPEGFRANTLTKATNREHSTVTVNGIADYESLAWILDGVFGTAEAALVDLSTGAYEREYEFAATSKPERSTYTVEFGDDTLASQVAHLVFHSFGLVANREDVTLNAGAFAGRIIDDITLAEATTVIDPIPVLAQQMTVSIGNAHNSLSALTRLVEIDYHCNNGVKPRYSANADTSFSESTELLPEHGGSLKLWKNSAAMALRALARANTRQWLKIAFVGPEIETDFNYKLELLMPIEFLDPGAQGDEDDAVAITLPFTVVYDGTNDLKITLINSIEEIPVDEE